MVSDRRHKREARATSPSPVDALLGVLYPLLVQRKDVVVEVCAHGE